MFRLERFAREKQTTAIIMVTTMTDEKLPLTPIYCDPLLSVEGLGLILRWVDKWTCLLKSDLPNNNNVENWGPGICGKELLRDVG